MEKVIDIFANVVVALAFLGADFMLFNLAWSEFVNRKKDKALARFYNACAKQIEKSELPYTE